METKTKMKVIVEKENIGIMEARPQMIVGLKGSNLSNSSNYLTPVNLSGNDSSPVVSPGVSIIPIVNEPLLVNIFNNENKNNFSQNLSNNSYNNKAEKVVEIKNILTESKLSDSYVYYCPQEEKDLASNLGDCYIDSFSDSEKERKIFNNCNGKDKINDIGKNKEEKNKCFDEEPKFGNEKKERNSNHCENNEKMTFKKYYNYDCNFLINDNSKEKEDIKILSSLNLKKEIKEKIKEGFIPIFIKIEGYKAHFFYSEKKITMNKLIKEYIERVKAQKIDKYVFKIKDQLNNIDLSKTVEELDIKPLKEIYGKKIE